MGVHPPHITFTRTPQTLCLPPPHIPSPTAPPPPPHVTAPPLPLPIPPTHRRPSLPPPSPSPPPVPLPQVRIVSEVSEADAVLGLRVAIKADAALRASAKAHRVPIYAIKLANTAGLVRAFRTLLAIDPSAGKTKWD